MEIRRVTKSDDFEQIGNIYALSWKAAYKGIVPQEYLDSLDAKRWLPVLENSDCEAFVLLKDGHYIGTSSICPARDQKMPGWGEIVSLYLLPDYAGKGYAKPLFETAVKALLSRGFANLYLWVLEQNIRAQRFYEKNGFIRTADAMTIEIAGAKLTEIRYRNR